MKKLTLLFVLMLSIGTYAQITLDFEKQQTPLVPVKLSNTLGKYLQIGWDSLFTTNSFRLLNADGSVYKDISLPPKPPNAISIYGLDYITNGLFDTDSTTIEYLITYGCDSLYGPYHFPYDHVVVADENGNILLNEKFADLFVFNSYGPQPIVQVGNQTKMVLWYTIYAPDYQFMRSKVFTLPGHLPNGTDESKTLSNNSMNIYPNPNNGSFFILSKSFENNLNTIDIYSINGKLIDTYRSTGNPVQVSNLNIGNGMYVVSPRGRSMKGSRVVIQK